MNLDQPPTIVVTGANSGIGLATVGALVERGARIVATVRSDEAAATVTDRFGSDVEIERLDVTDAEQCAVLIERHRPDVVVNNAGSALLGAVVDVEDDDARAQFDALVIAPVRLARLAAEHMRRKGAGRIVNVSSMLGQANVPFTGWYGAAKAALDSISDTLRLELEPAGIAVISIQCGAVATDVWDAAGDDVTAGNDTTTKLARHRWVQLTDKAQALYADPDAVGNTVAAAALDAHPRRIYRVGFGSRLGVVSSLIPRAVEDKVTSLLFRLGR